MERSIQGNVHRMDIYIHTHTHIRSCSLYAYKCVNLSNANEQNRRVYIYIYSPYLSREVFLCGHALRNASIFCLLYVVKWVSRHVSEVFAFASSSSSPLQKTVNRKARKNSHYVSEFDSFSPSFCATLSKPNIRKSTRFPFLPHTMESIFVPIRFLPSLAVCTSLTKKKAERTISELESKV